MYLYCSNSLPFFSYSRGGIELQLLPDCAFADFALVHVNLLINLSRSLAVLTKTLGLKLPNDDIKNLLKALTLLLESEAPPKEDKANVRVRECACGF